MSSYKTDQSVWRSALEVVESALDGKYQPITTRVRRGATNTPSESTAAPPEREVAERVHELYHSDKGEFDEAAFANSGDDRVWVFAGNWISHKYVPTQVRGNQRRAGVSEGALGDASMAGMSMAEMMAAAVKAQQEEETLELKTGMNKEMRAAAAKRQRRLQRERQEAQRVWRKKRMEENLGEGSEGEWRPWDEIETEGSKPLRAARLAARDRRRAKQTSLGKRVFTQVGRVVARAMSR